MQRCVKFLLLAAVLGSGCDRGPLELSSEPDSTLKSTRDMPEAMASALAVALAHSDAREAIISQMRQSPIVEHRITLVDALSSRDGTILNRVAEASGNSTDALIASALALPEMEFYGATAAQRQTWTAHGGAAAVALSIDGKSFTVFGPDGRDHGAYDRDSNAYDIVFLLAPVEASSYRIGWRSDPGAGDVIEDPSDAAGGLKVIVTDELGRTILALDVGKERLSPQNLTGELARVLPAVFGTTEPIPQSGQPFSSLLVTGTVVRYFEVQRISDVGGSAEVELKTWKYTGSSRCCEVKYRWEGVHFFDRLVVDPSTGLSCGSHPNCVSAPLIVYNNWYPGTGGYAYLDSQVWETDTGPDDHYGTHQWSFSQGGVMKTFWGGFSGGNAYCYFPDGSFSPCASVTYDGY